MRYQAAPLPERRWTRRGAGRTQAVRDVFGQHVVTQPLAGRWLPYGRMLAPAPEAADCHRMAGAADMIGTVDDAPPAGESLLITARSRAGLFVLTLPFNALAAGPSHAPQQ